MSDEINHDPNYQGNAELLFPSKYVRAADLGGKEVTVTIERVERDAELMRIGGQKDHKPLIHFAGTSKALVLNKTNKNTIVGLYGPSVKGWVGKRLTLVPATIVNSFTGKPVECIRIRDRIPPAPKPAGTQANPTQPEN